MYKLLIILAIILAGAYCDGATIIRVPRIGNGVYIPPVGGSYVLDLQFNGADEDTTTTDSSSSGHSVTIVGGKLDDAHKESGTTAYNFNTGGVTVPGSTDFELYDEATFSIRFWVYTDSGGPEVTIVYAGTGGSWRFNIATYNARYQAGNPNYLAEQQVSGFDFSNYGQGFLFNQSSHGYEVLFQHTATGEKLYIDGIDMSFTSCYAGHTGDISNRAWGDVTAITDATLTITCTNANHWVDNLRISKGSVEDPGSVPAGEGWYCKSDNMWFASEICNGAPDMAMPSMVFALSSPATACVPDGFGGSSSVTVNQGPVTDPTEITGCP